MAREFIPKTMVGVTALFADLHHPHTPGMAKNLVTLFS
jgi:hypothetical protein